MAERKSLLKRVKGALRHAEGPVEARPGCVVVGGKQTPVLGGDRGIQEDWKSAPLRRMEDLTREEMHTIALYEREIEKAIRRRDPGEESDLRIGLQRYLREIRINN
ncbi:MAG: hypothetical protein WC686_05760 [Candidatus Shapirobacteria bacterium]|jgi:hypothetical protein